MNGKWYDHLGIERSTREPVYKKIHQTVVAHGGKVYDMSDKDYEKYVLSDVVHVGWKRLGSHEPTYCSTYEG